MSESTLQYGLHSGGFVRMRLPEIRRAIFNDLQARAGIAFDETPDTFVGQFVSVFSEREAALWELIEQAYLSPYPVTAQGMQLDLAVSYAGVSRLQQVRSRALAYFTGVPGTIIPQGLVVQATVADDAADVPPRFTVQTEFTITKSSAVMASISIPETYATGTVFWIDLDGVRKQTTTPAGQTPENTAFVLGSMLGNVASISGRTINLFRPTPFAVDWSNNIEMNSVSGAGYLIAEEFGPIPVAAKTLTRILSPVTGLDSVSNPNAAAPGRFREEDDALRARYNVGVYRLGAGTLPSITANLRQDIPGVLSVRVFENITGTTDADGRPPHSIEAIVDGGDTQAIIDMLHNTKPSGIQTHGNTSGLVRDEDGYNHTIRFSRPEIRWVWLRVAVLTNQEETIPGDLNGRIVQALLDSGSGLLPGQDVILQRLQAAPFNATTGLAGLTITGAATAANAAAPTTYSATNIPMGPRQKAALDVSRITFV